MIDGVFIPYDLHAHVAALLRTLCGTCSSCVRRGILCRECDLVHVVDLSARMDACVEVVHVSSNPFVRRCVDAIASIRDAGRPVSALEISTQEKCFKTVKQKALRKICATGIVRREPDECGQYLYSIAPGQEAAADEVISRGEIDF